MSRLKNIRLLRVALFIGVVIVIIFAGSVLATNDNAACSEESQEIMDKNNIVISFTGLDYDGVVGPEAGLLIENNSDHNYIIQAEDMMVNGKAISPIFSCEIAPGQRLTDDIVISQLKLDQYGIGKIETLQFNFVVFNNENWYDDFYSDTVSLSF